MFSVFTPEQARSAAEERMGKDALRARGLAETTKELLQTKDEVEREFAQTMDRQRKEAEAWFLDTTDKKKALKDEVEGLLRQREEALSPLLIQQGDIHSIGESLKAREISVARREETVEEESRLLMRRMDELSSRETDIEKGEKRLKVAEQGLEIQRTQVREGSAQLTDRVVDFQTKMNDREFELSLRQSEQDATDNLQKEKAEKLLSKERELESARRLLEDDRATALAQSEHREAELTKETKRIQALAASQSLRQIELSEKEKHTETLHTAAEDKKQQIERRSEQYEAEYRAFQDRVAEMEQGFIYIRSELDATAKLQADKEVLFRKREQDNAKERKQIADQRVLLEKGFDELRKLKKK